MKKIKLMLLMTVIVGALVLSGCGVRKGLEFINGLKPSVEDATTEKNAGGVVENTISEEETVVEEIETVTEVVTEESTETVTEVPTEPAITEGKATQIVEDVLKRYEIFSNFGVCCDSLTIDEDLYDYMTDFQKTWALIQLKCTCCESINQVREHVLENIDESLWRRDPKDYAFEYNGNAYIATLPMGYDRMDIGNAKLISYDNNQIVVECSFVDFDGLAYATDKYTLEKVGENYVIVKVESV